MAHDPNCPWPGVSGGRSGEAADWLRTTYRITGVPVVLLMAYSVLDARFDRPWAPYAISLGTVLALGLAALRWRTRVWPRVLEVAVVLAIDAAIGVLGLTVVPGASGSVASMALLMLAVVSAARGRSAGLVASVGVGLVLGTAILVLRSGFPAGAVTAYLGIFLLTVITVQRLHTAMLRAQRQAAAAAVTDALTGVGNRSRLPEEFARLAEDARRQGASVGLVMLDLDHFKRVNDEHGHLMGDDVLRQVGDVLHRVHRPGDLTVRYGGEEFLLAAVVGDVEEMRAVAERVRAAVAALPTVTPVTVSAGVVARDPALLPPGGDLLLTLVAEADRALYRAKQQGRNQSVLA